MKKDLVWLYLFRSIYRHFNLDEANYDKYLLLLYCKYTLITIFILSTHIIR